MLTGSYDIVVVSRKSSVDDDTDLWKRNWERASGLPFQGARCQIEGCQNSAKLCGAAAILPSIMTESVYLIPICLYHQLHYYLCERTKHSAVLVRVSPKELKQETKRQKPQVRIYQAPPPPAPKVSVTTTATTTMYCIV